MNLVSLKEALKDDNVANHLFCLPDDRLECPGLISAKWTKAGRLKSETVWSFADLQQRVIQSIQWLQLKGMFPGDRVLLMVRPGLELVTLCFALFRLGVVPIVIDPGMGLKKFKNAVSHSKPTAIVGIPVAIAVSRVFKRSFSSVEKRITIHPTGFIRELQQLSPSSSQAPLVRKTAATDLAAVLFTSGSTGAPKGVCYEHGMFGAQIKLLKNRLDIQPGEVDLPMLPIFALFNPAMGMTTVIPEMNPSRPATVNPAKILAAIEKYGVTNSFGSPVLWRKIGDYCDSKSVTIPTLKRILVAGAAAPTQLYRQFEKLLPNGTMYSPYGSTECLPISLIGADEVLNNTASKTDIGRGICVGTTFDGVLLKMIRETGTDQCEIEAVEPGEIGEILASGPSVTKQYDRLPEATRKSKIVDSEGRTWHRMGDMGYFDKENRLWFCGRKIESIHGANKKVYYTEMVEGPYLTHPKVKRCAMIAHSRKGSVDLKIEKDSAPIALVIEPVDRFWPAGSGEKAEFARELDQHLRKSGVTPVLESYFFMKALPVDVRHNAKIHRLTLANILSDKTPDCIILKED